MTADDYLVTVRLFEISADIAFCFPDFDPMIDFDPIDFNRFKNDPIGYDLPEGFSLTTTVAQLTFTVVPEPTSTFMLLTGLFGVAIRLRCASS